MLFGSFLVENSIITKEQLDDGLKFQKITNNRIGETLVELAYLDRITLERYLKLHAKCNTLISSNSTFYDTKNAEKSWKDRDLK